MTGLPVRAILSNDEFIAALDALASEPAQYLRLRKKSHFRSLGTGMSGDDLLHEAIKRTLEDDGRNCPSDVHVSVYLDNAMRSIADGEREKFLREQPASINDNEEDPIENFSDHRATPEVEAIDRITLERVCDKLQDLFADDAQALAILIGDMEGSTPDEIRALEPMDDKQYPAARRRVRRAIEREFNGSFSDA